VVIGVSLEVLLVNARGWRHVEALQIPIDALARFNQEFSVRVDARGFQSEGLSQWVVGEA